MSSALGRHLVLIAESDLNDPRSVTAREAGGWGMNAQWSDDFIMHCSRCLAASRRGDATEDFGDLSQLAKAVEQNFVYDGLYSKFRNRMHGRSAGNLSHHNFLGYIQNHDQVGNRAVGTGYGKLPALIAPRLQRRFCYEPVYSDAV